MGLTAQSHELWLQFVQSLALARRRTWRKRELSLKIDWDNACPDTTTPVRLHDENGSNLVLRAYFAYLGLELPVNAGLLGLVLAKVAEEEAYVDVEYLDMRDLLSA